ncbi:D-alanyl-D-alanine carboxypeptidase/D-alanyl-D-alanine-endopeptidase [Nocardioides sp. WS12]|uniref:D-alanyl-D-alanine carboxypeptidase/D-alanyl-D-alanine endopeptidase n=1 Tax=Nocardioides sp. WS12 TaxID=2486272 RepID=UPI0015FA3E22|nr:D-alanyl-D-alanine carboxypeptidase/D-alanyl-D-alanine-endopeptidase [Nocardioides sp. WS12]
MASSDEERGSGRLKRAFGGFVVVALVAGGGVAWQTGWAEQQWDDFRNGQSGVPADPAAVAPPPEVDVPDVVLPGAVAEPANGLGPLNPAALKQALGDLNDTDLGAHVLAAVGPLDGTGIAYEKAEGAVTAIPASTTKIVTSAVALFLLGGDKVFKTTTVLDRSGTTPTLTLVGGGDPFLSSSAPEPATAGSATFEPKRASIRTLARLTARALKADGILSVQFAYDDSLFSGPAINPTWEPGYVPDDIAPITALWVDQGRDPDGSGRVMAPSVTAAELFRKVLARNGIKTTGRTGHAVAPAAATPVSSVSSPTVAQIVQRLIEVSDNSAAEVLLRQIGVADQGAGSSAAGQAGVERVLAANGVKFGDSVLYDGSGLSRDNRLEPAVLIGVLRMAAADAHPELRPLLAALPVAGFTGSLANRMDRGPAAGRGRVRAKTGTLSNVSSLAGIAVDRDGNLMAFALMADRIKDPKETLAQTALDNAAASLGACSCGR